MWFRDDLRTEDNPALSAAVASGLPVWCVWLHAQDQDPWRRGAASKVVLASALKNLEESLQKKGAHLHVLTLKSELDLVSLCLKSNVKKVFWNRRYDRYSIARDSQIKNQFKAQDVEVQSFRGNVLFEPWQVAQASGNPYKVYTPFWKVYEKTLQLDAVLPSPDSINGVGVPEKSQTVDAHVDEWLPKISWDTEIRKRWIMSEAQGKARLIRFLDQFAEGYASSRDVMGDESGTSRLSPYLALGVLTPRQIFWHIAQRQEAVISSDAGIKQFQKEVVWREFAVHLLFHFPHTDTEPLRENFKKFEWQDNGIYLDAWQRGQSGYPIVDAAMRELWQTGWMHNRARMIVASFLVKHLRIHWLEGAKWFWDTLVDADLASNSFGWQWTAGCGADAAPYFRIFNPTLQGERFDASGEYVRRWVPELRNLDSTWIHRPWEAPDSFLKSANIQLGVDYPLSIVDHKTERDRALNAFRKISATV